MATDRLGTASATVLGGIGAAVGGLLGGGSGVIYVPALDRLTTLPRAVLHGTSAAANIAVCLVGPVVFALGGGGVDLRSGSGLMLGSVIGGFFGAKLLTRLPETLLRVLFLAVLLVTGTKLFLDAFGLDPSGGAALFSQQLLAELWFVLPLATVTGVLIGAWAGAMGLGGGLLAVPALVLLFGTDLHTAEGTSLLMFLPTSIVSTVVHLRQGTADGRLSVLLNLGAVPGAIAGALLALALSGTVLSLVFGTFAIAMAIRELFAMRRAPAVSAPHPR
ncbi:sulfite exporter TauE/SafE family protein [Sciscionella sediminilitoris]|uniref:sulfite exporter TauE/SafE family protein n=1 Tax=Sciscionella sediminilitoris TaxID=1445613 RepID=UPI0004DF5107|nr:sulfite exporter TauE/SafE family protein [Sciscionella sp. SE31]